MPTCPQTPGAWMKMEGYYTMLSGGNFVPEHFVLVKPIIDKLFSENYSFGKAFKLVETTDLKDYLDLLQELQEQHKSSGETFVPEPGTRDYKFMQVEADLKRCGYEWPNLFQTKKVPEFLTSDAIQASLGVPINTNFADKPKTKSQLKRRGIAWTAVQLRRYEEWIRTSEKWQKKLFDIHGQQLYKLMQIPAKMMVAWIVDLVRSHELSLGQAFNSGFAWYKNKVHKHNVTQRKKKDAAARVNTAEYEMFLEYKKKEEDVDDAVHQDLDESHTAEIMSPETVVEGDKTNKKKHDAPLVARKRKSKKKYKIPTEELQNSKKKLKIPPEELQNSKKKLKIPLVEPQHSKKKLKIPLEPQKSSTKNNKKVKSPRKKPRSTRPTVISMRPSSKGSDNEDRELTDESTEETTEPIKADPVVRKRKSGKYDIDEVLVISSPESKYEKLGSCNIVKM
jgi:hypothetical protein